MEPEAKKAKLQPARVQLPRDKFEQLQSKDKETPGTVFNLWHLQESGGDSKKGISRNILSPCSWSSEDNGQTAAIESRGRFCVWFSRGMCSFGSRCYNLHRLPSRKDEKYLNPALDCFGREKHAAYRDDMLGVGSFMHENRGLIVSNFDPSIKDVEKVVKKRFAPFGRIEQVNTLGKTRVHVMFATEAQAQFAKEALSFQPLVKKARKGLIIKWAAPEPNQEECAKLIADALKKTDQG